MDKRTQEPQYQEQFDRLASDGPVTLGPTTSHMWRTDPRHLSYHLARYKVVAKLLSGHRRVLEAGCGDAFALDIVLQEVEHVHAVDFDPLFVDAARQLHRGRDACSFEVVDLTRTAPQGEFDAVYAMDVLEHIPPADEAAFLGNLLHGLVPQGVCLLGTPSAQSQVHASPWSKAGHVNCKTGRQLRELLLTSFHNAFVFGMNDEVLHLGFLPMAHYLVGLGVGRRLEG